MTEYQPHPAAQLFPMMSDAELRELADDIKANGLLEPIVIHDGQLLDGRNRLAACNLAGVEPRYRNPESPVTFPSLYVISKNVHRRHLTQSQRATIAAEMMPLLQEESRKRQLTGKAPSAPIGAEVEQGRSREIAAEALQIGTSSVDRAVRVKKADPETFEKVKRGEVSVYAADEAIKKRDGKRTHGGHVPKDLNTNRGRERAEAHKRRMCEGLGTIAGLCWGLINKTDVPLVAAICTHEELTEWAEKADRHARELRQFSAKLKEAING